MSATANLAKGALTSGVLAVERMLLRSPAFRRRVGGEEEGDHAAAARKIFLFYMRDDPELVRDLRPFAVVAPGDALDLETFAGGQRNFWRRRGGQVVLYLTDRERVSDPRIDGREAGIDFCAWSDAVLGDLEQMTGTDAPIATVTLLQKPTRIHPKDAPAAGTFWDVAWLLEW